jgi:hypothetical protein
MTACNLCLKDADLRNSHVLSEFLYKALYDDKHRAVAVSPSSPDKEGQIQKGIREKLLCGECEALLSRSETYAATVLPRLVRMVRTARAGTVVEVPAKYDMMKLFQLMNLWRVGIAQGDNYAAVDLGGVEPNIRRMLLEQDPGKSTDFPCLAVAPVQGKYVEGVIVPPKQGLLAGIPTVSILYSGIYWFHMLTRDPQALTGKPPVSLRRDVIVVSVANKSGLEMLRRIKVEIYE